MKFIKHYFSTTSSSRRDIPWARYFLLLFLTATFLAVYFPVIKGLVIAWSNSEEYSHGFFIVPLAVYIIWTKRERLAGIPVKPSWAGLGLIILSLLLYIAAHFSLILTLVSVSMVLALAGIILFLYGWAILKELTFPLFLLLFMIPVPGQIFSMVTMPLQLFVSKISVTTASHLGLSIFRTGNVIQLPDRTLEVVQACSGMRSLITLLTLSLIVAYLTLRSNLLRAVLFISGIPIAIFVNSIRVLFIILALHYFNIDLTTGTIHTAYGLIIFMLALVILMGFKGVLSNWDTSRIQKS